MSHPASSHISVSASGSGKCPVCGRRTTRSATFYSARTDGGKPVDTDTAFRAALAEAKTWTPDYTHRKCKGSL